MEKYNIEIAVDAVEAVEFKNYLNSLGHAAIIGRSTGNFVNGAWTSGDADANEIMNNLWDEYCSH